MVSQANKRWHDELDASYHALLVALTALALPEADTHWAEFKRALITHIDFEQAHIEPLATDIENNTLKLIQSDHLILKRLIPKIEQAMDAIRAATHSRDALVRHLDIFMKMRNVLAHHDMREMENLYPVIDANLDKTQRTTLARKMDKARESLH